MIERTASQKPLVDSLAKGQVEGTLWITVQGDEPTPMPNIPSDIIASAAQLKLNVFLENYTTLDKEVPEKLWLQSMTATGKSSSKDSHVEIILRLSATTS